MKGQQELRKIVRKLDLAHVALYGFIDRTNNENKMALEVARRDLIKAITQLEQTGGFHGK